ncbi:MAG TPA: hypothetical protein VG518_03585, partial [Solirubrobacterales bacterium]|nr:hypothetical protein [Solirubrobacterales bacterium]
MKSKQVVPSDEAWFANGEGLLPILRRGRSYGAGFPGEGERGLPEAVTIESLETVTDVMER